MAGIAVTKDQVDQVVGNTCKVLGQYFNEIVNIKLWLDANGSAGLEALGYTAADANTIISAFSDLSQLQQIFIGQQALPAAKDFRAFVKQLWGLGDV